MRLLCVSLRLPATSAQQRLHEQHVPGVDGRRQAVVQAVHHGARHALAVLRDHQPRLTRDVPVGARVAQREGVEQPHLLGLGLGLGLESGLGSG